MKNIYTIGLACIGAGILGFILYGVYNLLEEISSIEPIFLLLLSLILCGIIILFIAVLLERLKEKDFIDKEDLKP
jgi:hypothetical protein